ncbi:hypothetical protein [Bacillus wiedmannii]|uniref:Uncharacterized protein n=1 Tax=Bacillus wiedmannii TaxID=1890302 RepID=A0ABD6TDW1_9BACI|nr:hypothetical protein [Bacillus wiedmannii]PEO54217.1 hypothetical protein CN560_27210 [Bacillus wiedmannii]PGC75259.1 hypothetical protein COM25_13445 [Bacillus wiedmannii]PHG13105.1 hypothetical protein COI74_30190 [Bacillus wiedmannii]
MDFESTITISAIVSAVVTIVLFLIVQFVLEPAKEKKRKKDEKLKNLYAPLYTMTVAKLIETPEEARIEYNFFLRGESKNLNSEDYLQFILKNSRYASNDLLAKAHQFAEELARKRSYPTASGNAYIEVGDLVRLIVKEYNQLKKDLKESPNENELKTGTPYIYTP